MQARKRMPNVELWAEVILWPTLLLIFWAFVSINPAMAIGWTVASTAMTWMHSRS